MTRRIGWMLALALVGCDEDGAGHPADADVPDAGPMCPAAGPAPLAEACTPPSAPEVACAAEAEGPRAIRYTFDGAGRVTSAPGDGLEVSAYDAQGRRVRHEIADDGCLRIRWSWFYDGPVEVQRHDAPGETPGCVERRTVGEVDVEVREDPGCDCADVTVRRTCEVVDGRPVRCEHLRPDGTVSEVETMVWSPEGLLLRDADDFEADGVDDAVEAWTYDAQGRRTSRLSWIGPCDEPPCRTRWTWTYEDAQRRVTERVDLGDDGAIDRVDRRTADAEGRPVRREVSADGDDDFESVITWDYAVEGAITTTTRSHNGEVNLVETVEVDADGRVVATTSRLGAGDEARMASAAFAYDAQGRRVYERLVIDDPNGESSTCERRWRWSGDCPGVELPIVCNGGSE